ncbi:MAG: hypothetical protein OIF47_01595 [Marinibacterium sp.]|nr:hypothetical protein [Marinibacterium sp.]
MLNNAPSPTACCLAGSALPDTLDDLRAVSGFAELGHDLETLALIGTQFENALITTRNAGALIAGRGGYAALQRSDAPLRLTRAPRRVDLRFCPATPIRLARYADGNGGDGIAAFDHSGRVQHRVQLGAPADRQVLCSLGQGAVASSAPAASDTPNHGQNVIPLAAIRRARDIWNTADLGAHLNDLLRSCGRERRACLPHVGVNRAWQILPDVLPSFLTYASDRGIGMARFVPAAGLMQADVGPLETITLVGQLVTARAGAGTFSIDLSAIDSAWVAAIGRFWQIELYDAQGDCLAVLGYDPSQNAGHWSDLLCSLPKPASRAARPAPKA